MDTLLLKPVITEKSMFLAQSGWFTFLVGEAATKSEIAKRVIQEFNVHVIKVHTVMKKGKTKRTGKRRLISRKSGLVKKALVKLKQNEKIDLFDIGSQPQK